MAYKRSLDFLPSVFRTDVNDKFLHATVDQLISEPELRRLDGYVGRKFSPVAGPNDSFINELTDNRQNYQLEPHTTFAANDGKVKFAAGYTDLLRRIDSVGGFTNDHSRLFNNTTYNYDGFIDYDKFLNYSSYYWLPNGPDSVPVFATQIPLEQDFVVTPPVAYQVIGGLFGHETFDMSPYDVSENAVVRVREDGIKFDQTGNRINPTLRLARGGTYNFVLDQIGHGFFIQTQPGTTNELSYQANISPRDVFGVENNGIDVGTVTFKVPEKSAQDFFTRMPEIGDANLVAYSTKRRRALRYDEVHYKSYDDVISQFGGIDGEITIENKKIIFLRDPATGQNPQPWTRRTPYYEGNLIQYGTTTYRVLSDFESQDRFSEAYLEAYDLQDSWVNPDPYDSADNPYDMVKYDRGESVPFEQRKGVFTVTINSEGYVVLQPGIVVPRNNKINILDGINYGNKALYRDSNDDIIPVPLITASMDRFYYADSIDPNVGGVIEIVDQDNNLKIDVVSSILGKTKYESPNGVKLTNGLKIRFLNDVVQSEYANKAYYVEGVGKSIDLVYTGDLIANETWLDTFESPFDIVGFDSEGYSVATNTPLKPDYFVIKRNSIEKSAWTRHNRWFHSDIVDLTAKYNKFTNVDVGSRAKRPILEFDSNIQLWKFGQISKNAIDAIDTTTTDALSNIEGVPVTINESSVVYFTGIASAANNFKASKIREGYTVVKEITSLDGIVILQMKLTGLRGFYVDDIPLFPGMRVVFTADNDPDVRNNIYEVQWINPQSETLDRTWAFTADGSTNVFDLDYAVNDTSRLEVFIDGQNANTEGYLWSYLDQTIVFDLSTIPLSNSNITVSLQYNNQIHLVLAEDGNVVDGDCVYVKQGLRNQGKMYYYSNGSWSETQQKVKVNQPPKFDLYDINNVSYSDTNTYPSTDFVGCHLFGYETGSGNSDSILGLKLKYRNINNIGDIVFSDFITKGSVTYRQGQKSITQNTIGSKARENFADRTFTFRNQWRKSKQKSRQAQLQTYFVTDYQSNLFRLNVMPEGIGSSKLTNIIVYVNNKLVYNNNYDIHIEDKIAYLMLNNDLKQGDKLDIKIYSPEVNSESVFEVPDSFTNNPFNKEITDITLGQMRTHILQTIEDISQLSDVPLSEYNLRDTLDVKAYQGSILQHSGSTHLANFFLNDTQTNFLSSVINAQREYVRFKNRLLQLVGEVAVPTENASQTLERVMIEIVANKNKNFAYFTSDMLPFGNDYKKRIYEVIDTRLTTYDLSEIFDVNKPSDKAVLVYHNGRQLLSNRDYTISSDRPVIELDLTKVILAEGDVIEIREYVSTDGSYIPPTPSKFGLYPLFIPMIVQDGQGEYIRNMVRGHDGSLIAMYNDIRDDVLLEFETRIYNNIKTVYNPDRFDVWDYVPGGFRSTDYSYDEFMSILSSHFSSWSGSNGMSVSDYRQFVANDPFSYNYGRFTNRIDGKTMPASHWRGLYRYYYDTDAPHLRPWEMIGFTEQPYWWEYQYGPAPYTSGNEVLWKDLEAGRIVFGDNAGIDTRFARPGLSTILPVDGNGELLSPMEAVSKDINELDVTGFFRFGDGGPVETAWRQSSEYPFVLQIAIAIMKPTEYFGYNIDTNKQVLSLEDGQIIFSDTNIRSLSNQLVQNEIDSDGKVYRVNSYTTWISEYCKSRGLDVTKTLGEKIRRLESKLGYKVGGYTDKKYLKVITDQYTPASNNPGVIIPDDDFEIVLNKSAPVYNLTYSGVIITKTADGYAVSGYDDNKPYFSIEASSFNNNKSYIKVGNLAVTKYYDGTGEIYRVPYGTEFFSNDQLADFLISYGRYLTRQGFQFTDKLDADASWYLDWDLAVREFLFYVQQGWDVDIALSVSPVGSKINYTSPFGTVDALSNRPLSTRILDEDFKIVRTSDYTVTRHARDFNAKVDSDRGIYLLDLDVVEYEHVLIFNNKTRFNDIIYDPIIGDRQHRLRLQGFKTGDWDGTYSAAGFIINEDNVEDWRPGVNYSKGEIVTFKGDYFTAGEKIAAASDFTFEAWIKTEYSSVKKGLLPNLANRAGLSKNFYNVNEVNLEQDAQKLGKNLIGFEARSYMEDIGISDTSQFKFYQGMISQKGTNSSLDKLLKAKVDNFGGFANVYEEWAVRLGNYGATSSTRNLQIELDEAWAVKDPLVIELLDDRSELPTGHKGLKSKDLLVKHVPFDKDFLNYRLSNSENSDLYSAGYAQLSDVDYTSPTRSTMNAYVQGDDVGAGDLVWIAADRNNQWNIYRIDETDIRLETANIVTNGNATIRCVNNHNLEKNDLIFIRSDNTIPGMLGFFTVTSIVDLRTFVISTGFGAVQIKPFSGFVYKLKSMRFNSSQDVAANEPMKGWKNGDKLFIDNASDTGWKIYENQLTYKIGPNFSTQSSAAGDKLGHSVATDPDNYYMIAGRPGFNNGQGGVILYNITSQGFLEETANLSTSSAGATDVGFSVTASQDSNFAAGAPTTSNLGIAVVFSPGNQTGEFRTQQVITSSSLDAVGEFGYSVKLSSDGNWLAVGQPGANEGYVYLYQRRTVKILPSTTVSFTGDGSSTAFELTDTAANPNSAESLLVVQDGIALTVYDDYDLSGSTVILSAAPAYGSNISITVLRSDPGQTYIADGSTSTFALSGDNASPTSIYALFVEVNGVIQVPFRDFELTQIMGINVVVLYDAPVEFSLINISQRTHYEFITAFTDDDAVTNDRFGESIEFTKNARQLIVGAPMTTVDGVVETGRVYIYDRSIETYYGDGVTDSFNPVTTPQGQAYVYVDDVQQVANVDFLQLMGEIRFTNPPAAGSLIRIETNNWSKTAQITQASAQEDLEKGARFGQSLVACPLSCSIFVGAPQADVNRITNSGKVYRFINQGRFFGNIYANAENPTISVDSQIMINNFIVPFLTGDTLSEVIAAINNAEIPGVLAYSNNGYLYLEANSIITGEKLLVASISGNALTDLGIEVCPYQQTINSPDDDFYVEFGRTLAINPTSDLLAVGSSRASTRLETTIDGKTTYFDARATAFNDIKKQSGAAWLYQYIPTANSTIENPGQFISAQRLVNPMIDNLDEFGTGIAISKSRIFVGAPSDDTLSANAGLVFSFESEAGKQIWNPIRSEEQKVDIDLINRMFLYNKNTHNIITELDYIDPIKGKISGYAAQEIAYQTPFDPAVYNKNSAGGMWGKDYVGKVWWDISQSRWLNYEQSDVSNRGINWNSAFPGSTIICYEWVESELPPTQFVDKRDPTAFVRSNSYNLLADIDPNTGVVVNKYYYWVAGKRTIPQGINRKYSTVDLENFIANPRATGMPFAAFVASNAIALFNCSALLQDTNVVLSIDYDVKYNENSIHSEFQLIAENDANSIPDEKIIRKLVDSLAGADSLGNLVPDIKLTAGEKYGVEYRPRQSIFMDRKIALKSAVDYINRVLATIPARENKDINQLLAYDPIPNVNENLYDDVVNDIVELGYLNIALLDDGYRVLVKADSDVSDKWSIYRKESSNWILTKVQTFDNRRYVEAVDWVKPGVADPVVTNYTVDFSYQVSSITPEIGNTVKVRDSGNNRYSILRYNATGYELIKKEAATFKIVDAVWDESIFSQGFDRETYDIQSFDDWSSVEIQSILHAVYNDIFVGDEQIEKNRWFLLMMQHLLAEQKYVDWIFKTSFIKVEHRNQQAISQIASLQKDRQDSLRKYIEEVKPYHTKIREFVNSHEGFDNYKGDVTDFDVPAYYEPSIKKYRSPTGLDEIDDVILDRPVYSPWLNNHELEISSILVYNPGFGYSDPPELTVVGTTGTGAKLEPTIVNGQITSVNVINAGTGFTTTPTIEIGPSSGTDAILIPIMTNTKVRSVTDIVKFDRIPNNGGFLIQFMDGFGDTVDIRQQKKSRLFGEQGILDEMLEALTFDVNGHTHWIKESISDINWPVDNANNYRIFDDTSGRIQVQYKKFPGGWTADTLQTYLRSLGEFVGVDGLDITGTTVTVDGNMSLYAPSVLEWLPFTRYDRGDIVVHNNHAYVLRDEVFSTVTEDIFDDTDFREYDASEFESHLNRTWTYYQPVAGLPGKDLGQLFAGVEYPGIKVQGASFRQEPGFDVGNFDMSNFDQYIVGPEGIAVLDDAVLDQTLYSTFLDTTLGTKPEDIITSGGSFVDVYSSHAPEEAIPGRVYDTLSILVHTLSTTFTDTGSGYSPEFNVNKYYSTGLETRFKYRTNNQIHQGDYFLVYSTLYGPLYRKINETNFAPPGTIVTGGYYDIAQQRAYSVDWQTEEIVFDNPLPLGDLITVMNIGQIGENIIVDDIFTADGSTTAFKIKLNGSYGNVLVLENGMPTDDCSVQTISNETYVVFNIAPAANTHVHIVMTLDTDSAVSYINTQYSQINNTNRTLVLNRPIEQDRSKDTVMIVEVDGLRLRPGNSNYFVGDGSTIEFALPTSADDNYGLDISKVQVWIDGTQVNVSDYIITTLDGSSLPIVMLTTPPPNEGADISVTYTAEAEYTYNPTTKTITVLNTVDVVDGSLLAVTAFSNHDAYKLKTKIFKGVDFSTATVSVDAGFGDGGFDTIDFDTTYTLVNATGKNYVIDSDQSNSEKVFFSVNGKTLSPGFDYTVSNGVITVSDTININADTIIIVTWMSSNVFIDSTTFRLFKDLNDNVSFNRVAIIDSTVLAKDLSIKDESIYLVNANALGIPNIDKNVPGVIFINGERITFWEKNGNVLSKIRRGTAGTAAVELYAKDTLVVDGSGKSVVPSGTSKTWYNLGDDAPSDGNGLMLSDTIQANFLKASKGIIPSSN